MVNSVNAVNQGQPVAASSAVAHNGAIPHEEHLDRAAVETLVAALYPDLRRMAAAYLRRERRNHTLQPTALVHDVYLRLLAQASSQWNDKGHFLAVAARTMRRILADHARARSARKRTPTWIATDVDWGGAEIIDLLAVNEALERLDGIDHRLCQVVELRFFAGLSVEEAAQALGVSPRTVKSDWQTARAWLSRELADNAGAPS